MSTFMIASFYLDSKLPSYTKFDMVLFKTKDISITCVPVTYRARSENRNTY